MDKEITYSEFVEAVLEDTKWAESVQYPAARVRDRYLKLGIINAVAMYEQYRKNKGELFYYIGD